MSTSWEIPGISLQLATGFVFILRQVAEPLLSRNLNLKERFTRAVYGYPTRRWRIPLVAALLAFTLVIITLALVYGGRESVSLSTLSTIGAAVIFIYFGFNAYLYSLKYTQKAFRSWKRTKHRLVADTWKGMLFGNIFLCATSGALFFTFVYTSVLYSYSSRSVILIVPMALFVFIAAFIAFPIFFLSTVYLATLAAQKSLFLLTKMPNNIFWALLLALWTLGGTFLLLGACCS